MHEDFGRSEKVKVSSDRSFGLALAGAFLLIGLIPLLHSPHQPRLWAISIAIVFGTLAQFAPDCLYTVFACTKQWYRAWIPIFLSMRRASFVRHKRGVSF